MSITVGRYQFEGPYTNTASLEDRSGVYAVHCYRDERYYLVDVGESGEVKNKGRYPRPEGLLEGEV